MAEKASSEQRFIEAASEYCELVASLESYPRHRWLARVAQVLSRIEEAMESVAARRGVSPAAPAPCSTWSELEAHFELYSRIKKFLAEEDEYWSEGDLAVGDGHKTGSLADDFTDIFFEISRGIGLLAAGERTGPQAFQAWTLGYGAHWRQHLVDACKQLLVFRSPDVSLDN